MTFRQTMLLEQFEPMIRDSIERRTFTRYTMDTAFRVPNAIEAEIRSLMTIMASGASSATG